MRDVTAEAIPTCDKNETIVSPQLHLRLQSGIDFVPRLQYIVQGPATLKLIFAFSDRENRKSTVAPSIARRFAGLVKTHVLVT